MLSKKTNTIFNVIAAGFLAYIMTIPVHEFIHLITFYLYGDKVEVFTSISVHSMDLIEYAGLSEFDRIMVGGGSASIFNVIVGSIIISIILNIKIGPMLRVFLILLMGMHFSEGFAYFAMGGLFCFGDWGNVFSYFPDDAGMVLIMRIVLAVIGVAGIIFTILALIRLSYSFISDPTVREERFSVSFKLYCIPFIVIYTVGILMGFNSYLVNSGKYGIGFFFLSGFNFIPLVYAFLVTWLRNRSSGNNRFLYELPGESHYIVWAISIILMLLDALVLAPGIRLN